VNGRPVISHRVPLAPPDSPLAPPETNILVALPAPAVGLADELMPDVIPMDLSMPKLNGVEATRVIRKNCPDIRILGLSMFEEEEPAQAILGAGAVDYLNKSGPSSDLIAAIRKAGRRKTSQDRTGSAISVFPGVSRCRCCSPPARELAVRRCTV
jgi:DNA-binding NarL/FixJ family response regulator